MHQELNGILVVDKPPDITSAGVVARLKRRFKVKKIGHAGTLDPFATGVLVCCINRATKLSRFFLEGNKKYEAVLKLGVETDTFDSTGNIISVCNKTEFTEKRIVEVFRRFEGEMDQFPPVYSALKHKGVPLYKLARSGKPVQKPPRRVFISRIEVVDIQLSDIRFDVTCSSGTYIRTLCSDIGKMLGCGGHLKALRRTQSSRFSIGDSLTLKELEQTVDVKTLPDKMIRMTDALCDMGTCVADGVLSEKIGYGRKITGSDLRNIKIDPGENREPDNYIKIVNSDNSLLAVINSVPVDDSYTYCCVFN
ncbi:MAG: tRNA pseudouridine(55) synthase TruB [Desulfobacterales bacterium]|nr:tRNA pseudouridine(55) synthase TruB [Desulfobacterales bacterium]